MRTAGWLICAGILSCAADGQESDLLERFHRLMGEPKKLTGQLLDYPWRSAVPTELPGLLAAPHPDRIHIGSVTRPVSGVTRWKHWSSEDGKVWADLLTFDQPGGAVEALRSGRQVHSGYIQANQLLLFSNTGDVQREALGAAVALSNGSLLNVGTKLPIAVSWDRPLPPGDVVAFDEAFTRFLATLDSVTRAFLDPAYVALGTKIEAKPEALSLLRVAGFARLWTYVKYNFVYLDRRPGLNWDGVLEEYLPRVATAKSDAEYGKVLQQAVALLKDGHTGVYPNSADPADSPAILLEPIGGKPVATVVGSLSELDRIKPGMELVEIDGRPVADVIARDIDPYIFSSTPQDRQMREMFTVLEGPPGSVAQTKWVTLDGVTVEAPLHRNASQNRAALKLPNHPRFEYRNLAGDVAYIGLNTFNEPAIKPEFEAKLKRLNAAKAWIVDLRNNGGGSSDIAYAILARMIDAPVEGSKQSTRLYNPTLAARNEAQPWYDWPTEMITPAVGPRYQGPVYVLTSPRTCSAAEDFLIPLRTIKRITIVGEPSCGSTGQPLQFSIYGATARVCTKWDRFPDGTEFVGVGVVPDVRVARTKEDVVTGRDAVLETALRLALR